jgi:hypothetical protein
MVSARSVGADIFGKEGLGEFANFALISGRAGLPKPTMVWFTGLEEIVTWRDGW